MRMPFECSRLYVTPFLVRQTITTQSDQTQNDNNMSTQKRKFELFARLQALGFTYEEAVSLRRIEMTLQRWGELECGNDRGCIERDEVSGKPYMTYDGGMNGKRSRYAVADREAGALKRLNAIVGARNARTNGEQVYAYHQTDCRGCNLYLVKASQLPATTDAEIIRHSGPGAAKDKTSKLNWKLSCYYTRGLAVCA